MGVGSMILRIYLANSFWFWSTESFCGEETQNLDITSHDGGGMAYYGIHMSFRTTNC